MHEVPVSLYLNYNIYLSSILIFLPDFFFLLHNPPLQSPELITCNKAHTARTLHFRSEHFISSTLLQGWDDYWYIQFK